MCQVLCWVLRGLGKIEMSKPLRVHQREADTWTEKHVTGFQVLSWRSPDGGAVVQRRAWSLLPGAGGEVDVMKKH